MGEWIDGGDWNSLTWVAPAAFLIPSSRNELQSQLQEWAPIPPSTNHRPSPPPRPELQLWLLCNYHLWRELYHTQILQSIWKSSASQQTSVPNTWINIYPWQTWNTKQLTLSPYLFHQPPASWSPGSISVWMTRGCIQSTQHSSFVESTPAPLPSSPASNLP